MPAQTKASTPSPEQPLGYDTLAQMSKALGHPARIRIIEHLRTVDRCICGQIVNILPLAQSTVSQHLKILKQARLIRGQIEGPAICYCIDQDMLEKYKQAIAAL